MKEKLKKTAIAFAASVIVYIILSIIIDQEIINNYTAGIIKLICINIIMALSLNLITGFTGQLALGHAGFMAIGAYTAAMLTMKANFPFLLALIAGGIFTAVISFVIGVPTLKLKGDYLAITTLGFCQIISVIIQNIPATGGAAGLVGIPPKASLAWVYFSMVVTAIIIYNVVNSSQGRAMISVREDEIAAEAMGVNTTKYKIMAFVIGAFFAGFAGGLYAHYIMFLDPKQFDFLKSTDYVVYVVLGGLGNIPGSIISASVLTYLPEGLRGFGDFRMVVYPVLLIVIMLLNAKGLSLNKLLKRKTSVKGGKPNGAA
ncbi:branched-chain amino acid ABC transporter permease [Clostridium sp. 19966]|uniref:branched-chain amino acid ABC transporter permease n=1 Tax=Clostridium sp. 19966 TaxID=2768166 RepID=UPI0028DEC7A3|nr:branched-chain amino acid ABC transporter permease [Clostridium sp. 19966]MDT8716708.1 branched-chain amino acid ABC transporter permease [Clostridium sp. 19966]